MISDVKKRRKLIGAAAAVLWILFGITGVIRWIAGDGAYLAAEMAACAAPEETGLPAEEYTGVGRMTADYLTGRGERFQYSYPDRNGNTILGFHDYEEAHMADCRGLIRLDTAVTAASGAAALALTAWGLVRRREREAFCRGILLGLRILCGVILGLVIWAVIDFDGLFITFHRAAFSNDGWLLNPRTDLLIRLMPEKFFIRLGIRGLIRALAVPAGLAAAAGTGLRRINGRDGK